MSKNSIFIALGFAAFGAYEFSLGKMEEGTMYLLVGLSFLITWWSYRENIEPETKKLLTILSWVLIFAAGFLFLFLVRTDLQR